MSCTFARRTLLDRKRSRDPAFRPRAPCKFYLTSGPSPPYARDRPSHFSGGDRDMSKLRAGAFFSLLYLAAALTGRALACSTDADCDNGDVCSVPDTCVAGICLLGGGGDVNGDLVCD